MFVHGTAKKQQSPAAQKPAQKKQQSPAAQKQRKPQFGQKAQAKPSAAMRFA
jgi:hypothetical protein